MNNETFEMVAKTLYGLEEVLAGELISLGANEVQIGRRMVSFEGNMELLYKANFYCRTALRILRPIYHFKAKDADTVYKEVMKVEWDKYLTLDKTFAIDSVIYSEDFNHSKFVAYRTKDAIVDYFMEKYEKRPSVRVNNPDLYINIHISHNDCTLSIDSSGESLHKRGYRVDQIEAPLNEVLAAGLIMKTGWKGESNFIDPMCGSGTLLIEAAMIALNIAPGVHRKGFAFEKWVDFDQELFDRIYNDESNEKEFTFKCYGSDVSPDAIEIARKNVRSAGLSKYIDLQVLPFQQFQEPPKPGIMVTNPPYGERISSRDLMGLYTMIGERMKHVFAGYKVWILSYKDECFEKIGLRPSEKMKVINGSLECEFRCYDIFEGKNKDYKKSLAEGEESSEERPARSYSSERPERQERSTSGERSSRPERSFGGERTARPERSFGGERSARPERSFGGERAPRKEFSPGGDRPERKNFRTDRPDRPDRRFAAAHSESEAEKASFAPGKRFFGEERNDGRPARKPFGGDAVKRSDSKPADRPVKSSFSPGGPGKNKFVSDRPTKMKYKEDDRFGGKNFKDKGKSFKDKKGGKDFRDTRIDKKSFGDLPIKKIKDDNDL